MIENQDHINDLTISAPDVHQTLVIYVLNNDIRSMHILKENISVDEVKGLPEIPKDATYIICADEQLKLKFEEFAIKKNELQALKLQAELSLEQLDMTSIRSTLEWSDERLTASERQAAQERIQQVEDEKAPIRVSWQSYNQELEQLKLAFISELISKV